MHSEIRRVFLLKGKEIEASNCCDDADLIRVRREWEQIPGEE